VKHLPFKRPEDTAGALGVAADVVAAGGVVLIPTESYYGLGADPLQPTAVQRVAGLKGRPGDLGMPVVCCDWDQIDALVEVPATYRVKLSRLWPAALTVVAPQRIETAAARSGTLAVRIPDHDLLRVLLYRVGPLTATSANRHGTPPSVTVSSALASLFDEPDLVLDGGELAGGRVSTLVDLTADEPLVIRPGAAGWEERFDLEEWRLLDH
jgi:tRNA threonylcarbamoyl adenosine modification protein (Sua5/YciO/YrdC/YwlC family)